MTITSSEQDLYCWDRFPAVDREPKARTVEQADGNWLRGGRQCAYHRWLKRQKNRHERKRARVKPDCLPGYGRYRGWES